MPFKQVDEEGLTRWVFEHWFELEQQIKEALFIPEDAVVVQWRLRFRYNKATKRVSHPWLVAFRGPFYHGSESIPLPGAAKDLFITNRELDLNGILVRNRLVFTMPGYTGPLPDMD